MKRKPLSDQIRELCEQRGLKFKPWETTPWEVDFGPSPWPSYVAGGETWPQAQALRRKLIAELRQAKAGSSR